MRQTQASSPSLPPRGGQIASGSAAVGPDYVYNTADPLVAAASVLLILLTLGVILEVERAMGLSRAFVK